MIYLDFGTTTFKRVCFAVAAFGLEIPKAK